MAYVPGVAMRCAARLYPGAAKSDPKDAQVLADFARRNVDRLEPIAAVGTLLAHLRILNGRDTALAKDAHRVLCRLQDALMGISPALGRAIGSELVSRAGMRDLLEKWPTAAALKAAGEDGIRARIAERSPRAAGRLADAVWAALEAQTIVVASEDARGVAIACFAGDLNRIQRSRGLLFEDIKEAYLCHPSGKILSSLCGFGPRTGARALVEIGDPHRFKGSANLAAYAGLAPVVWQSGRSKKIRRTRTGNPRLRTAFYQAAFVAIRFDPQARAYYKKKRAEGKGHVGAVTCVARKRCDIVHAMLTTQTPYQPPEQGPSTA